MKLSIIIEVPEQPEQEAAYFVTDLGYVRAAEKCTVIVKKDRTIDLYPFFYVPTVGRMPSNELEFYTSYAGCIASFHKAVNAVTQ